MWSFVSAALAGPWVQAAPFPAGEFQSWHGMFGEGDLQLECGVRLDGTLACFDRATLAPAKTALPAGPLRAWAFGGNFACGLDATDVVRCGPVEKKRPPRFTPPTEPLRKFALYGRGLCGVRSADGGLVCAADPNTAMPAPRDGVFTDLSCSHHGCCALRADGALACFGEGTFYAEPVPTGPFTDVATDGSSACALEASGSLRCWGSSTDTPREVPPGPFVSVDPGYVARRADGTSFVGYASWYVHLAKELPALRWVDRTLAVGLDGRPFAHTESGLGPVPAGPMVDVDAGLGAVCAIGADTGIHCFGDDGWVTRHAPTDGGYVEVGVANNAACARRGDGAVRCWGKPDWVANQDAAFASLLPGGPPREPGADAFSPSTVVTSLADGSARCGTTASGAVCWDHAGIHPLPGATRIAERVGKACTLTAGQLRCGTLDELFGESGGFLRDVSGVTDVAVGYEHSCALTEAGATCEGRDVSGETVPPPGAFRQLALAEKRSCGLRPDGRAVCWGGAPRAAPDEVFTDLAVTQETDLRMQTWVCGIRKTDRTLVCWPYS